ncbi:MAG TPA: MBL fold metallo-hydrolase [Candidatus Sulfotelmatobacter sp.]|nr:MBL fold metallo-hydrolase [Candidatus Sulfotelmatobacter sp.]
MDLTFHGASCLRLRGREIEVVIDPHDRWHSSKGRLGPDIVVRTEGATSPERLRPAPGRPQEVSGPGEYEIRGVAIFGLPAAEVTIMRVEVDEVRVVSLGKLKRQLSEEEIEALGHIDVLAIPVGGGDALGATEAAKLVNTMEPPVVVPVRYRTSEADGGSQYDTIARFAKEMGLPEGWSTSPKLTLSGSMAATEESRVVILEPRER